jgi:hypothetical protein
MLTHAAQNVLNFFSKRRSWRTLDWALNQVSDVFLAQIRCLLQFRLKDALAKGPKSFDRVKLRAVRRVEYQYKIVSLSEVLYLETMMDT